MLAITKNSRNNGESVTVRSPDIGELFVYMSQYFLNYPPNPYDTTATYSCDTLKGEWILTLNRYNAD